MRIFAQKQDGPQKQVASSFARSNPANGPNHPADLILHLQRKVGNQALLRMLQTPDEEPEVGLTGMASPRFGHDFSPVPVQPSAPAAIQIKPAIHQPGDKFEQEADRISERVMRIPQAQREGACGCGGECPKCETEQPSQERKHLQAKRIGSGDPGTTLVPPVVHEVLHAPGQPLDPATRASMEPRFGHDFAKVRVHTNNHAGESAEAVNALAYTVGNHVVFGAGQYAPGSSRGQRLLTHELSHVVQQNGGQTSHGMARGQYNISGAPISLMTRKGPLSDAEEQEEQRKKEAPKKEAIKKHEDEQRTVIDLMDKARKIQPDPKRGIADPDNLLRNTVQMFDAGRFRLTVLSPTHYSQQLHFDPRVKHPNIGGDYPLLPPKDPMTPGAGLMYEPGAYGRFVHAPSGVIGSIQTLPPKVERAPGEAAPKESPAAKISTSPPTFSPFVQGDIFLFTQGLDVESQFRQTFVHEGQHVADLSTQRIAASPVDEKLEAYKSEYRAFWMQPPLVRTSELAVTDTRFAEPTEKASNSRQVTIDPQKKCSTCPPNDPSGKPFAEPKTAFKNARQEEIFWHIIDNYPKHGFDCCYVYNEQFHREVNRFAQPESINLINSERLMNLNLELQNLNKSMVRSQVSATDFVLRLSQLEPLDWAFLNDPKLAKPFWDTLNANAPEFVKNGVKGLLKKGMKAAVSEAEAKKALSR